MFLNIQKNDDIYPRSSVANPEGCVNDFVDCETNIYDLVVPSATSTTNEEVCKSAVVIPSGLRYIMSYKWSFLQTCREGLANVMNELNFSPIFHTQKLERMSLPFSYTHSQRLFCKSLVC